MATYLGKDGYAEVVTAAGPPPVTAGLGEMRGFTINETAEFVDTTVMGSETRTKRRTFNNWTGSMEFLYDPDDAGQAALTIGSTVTCNWYPEDQDAYGTPDAGDQRLSGTVIITDRTITAAHEDLMTLSVSFEGTDALTKDTV